MKKISMFFLCLSITAAVFAQTQYEGYAPVNPDYIIYKESSIKAGFIPPRHRVSFDSLSQLKSALVLPEVYDMRALGLLDTPRDQQDVNACWTFATMNAIQSTRAKMGFDTTPYSVENLATCHGFLKTKEDGGNADMAIAYFARYGGPVYESADPFINSTTGTCNDLITNNDKAALVTQLLFLPKQVQTIKQMLYRYGGVFTAMDVNQLRLDKSYNPDSFTVFRKVPPVDTIVNHAVTIVGWDDNKIVYNPLGDNPQNPGVWIIKNTVGTSKYDGGYFYASYEDCFIGSYASVYPQRLEKAQVDTVFYYDKLGHVTNYGFGMNDEAWAVLKFTAAEPTLITSVGTYASVASTELDIQVYQNKTGNVLSGLLGEKKNLLCEYPGYYTFDVPASVSGDFYVKVRYKTPGSYYPIPIEMSEDNYSVVDVKPVGLQWIQFDPSDSLRAVGLAHRQFNLSVNVYGQYTTSQPLFSTTKNRYCLADTVVFKNTTVGTYDTYNWHFGEGATPQTALTATTTDSVKVVYSTEGMKTITLKATSGATTDSIVTANALEVLSGVPLKIQTLTATDSVLKNKEVTLLASGADAYYWQASASIPDTTGHMLSFTIGETDELIRLSAVLGQCAAQDSIYLTVYDKCALYDDIADAKSLSINVTEGPFSNVCATWQANEPYPALNNSCTSQYGWCPYEDRLYSSLWFKFVAPNYDSLRVITTGLDNKIALYDATATGTYADIISGNPANYTLLAANDDSSDFVYSATIEALPLTSGKTYWLQLDGSYGGQEGDSYITLVAYNAVGLHEAKALSPVVVNLVKNGTVFILQAEAITQVQLIDLSGNILFVQQNAGSASMQFSVGKLQQGYYMLNMQTKDGFFTEKILIEE